MRGSDSSLTMQIVEGMVEGKRKRGRQKKQWFDNIREWTGLSYIRAKCSAQNRSEWRRIIKKSVDGGPQSSGLTREPSAVHKTDQHGEDLSKRLWTVVPNRQDWQESQARCTRQISMENNYQKECGRWSPIAGQDWQESQAQCTRQISMERKENYVFICHKVYTGFCIQNPKIHSH